MDLNLVSLGTFDESNTVGFNASTVIAVRKYLLSSK